MVALEFADSLAAIAQCAPQRRSARDNLRAVPFPNCPGSYVEVGVRPETDGGTRLQVDWNRRGVGIKGKMMIAFVVLTRGAIIRRKVFQRAFDRERAGRAIRRSW